MRWLSSRSNRAREEMATTRRFSRLWAMVRFPGEEALHEGEIERHFNTRCSQVPHQGCVSFQLRRVARPLLLQERFDVGAAVAAGLIIDYPTCAVRIHEAAVDDAGLQPSVTQQAERVLAARL